MMNTNPFENDGNSGGKFYKKIRVNQITPEDSLISICGYAKNVNASDEFYLDDESGRIHVREIPEEVEKIQENQIYRILGEYSIDGAGTAYISARIVQNMAGLDFKLFLKSMDLIDQIK